jgi:hypothetical protein
MSNSQIPAVNYTNDVTQLSPGAWIYKKVWDRLNSEYTTEKVTFVRVDGIYVDYISGWVDLRSSDVTNFTVYPAEN